MIKMINVYYSESSHNYASTLVGLHISFWNFKVLAVSKQDLSHVCVCSVMPNPMQPARLLCPQDFPGNDIGVSSHSLLQRIFPTQGWNKPMSLSSPDWQVGSLPLAPPGKSLCPKLSRRIGRMLSRKTSLSCKVRSCSPEGPQVSSR